MNLSFWWAPFRVGGLQLSLKSFSKVPCTQRGRLNASEKSFGLQSWVIRIPLRLKFRWKSSTVWLRRLEYDISVMSTRKRANLLNTLHRRESGSTLANDQKRLRYYVEEKTARSCHKEKVRMMMFKSCLLLCICKRICEFVAFLLSLVMSLLTAALLFGRRCLEFHA